MSVLGAVAFALFASLFARVWFLQVINEQDFVTQAEGNRERTLVELAPRGRILDINDKVLVDNRASIQVTIDKETIITEVNKDERPALFLDLAKEISSTGRLTKVSEIEDAFASDQYGPFAEVPVVGDVTEELQLYLAENSQRFPGVHTRVVTVREYPYGSAAAHLLGYVGALNEDEFEATANKPKNYQINDEIGKSGVELFYEDHLRGTPGTSVIEVDKFANVLDVLEYTPPVAGSDIRLTIDIDLQIMAEQELEAALLAARLEPPETDDDGNLIPFNAPGGAVVLLDPQVGAVRAMASYPTYDPSTFVGGISSEAFLELSDEDGDLPLLNRAIQGEYAPGSTFKPFTAYAALDTGLLGPRGVLDVRAPYNDTGVYFIPTCPDDPSCRFQNAGQKPYGAVDLRRALTVSSDTYFYNLAANFDRLQFDRDSVQQAAKLFGFGAPTGLTLPNENAGYIPTPQGRQARHEANPEAFPFPDWRTGDTIVTSIGQGDVLATPMQMATAYAALANGGDIYAPNLASAVLSPLTGEPSLEFKARRQRSIYYPPEFSDPISDGLLGVTQDENGAVDGGTAWKAFNDINFPHASWLSAGKTGTSEKDGKADFALYVGYGPLPEAEYVGVAVLEEAGFGGNVAAPVIAKLFKAIATDSVEPALTQAERDEQDRIAFEAAQAGLSVEEFVALENPAPSGDRADADGEDAATDASSEAGEG